MADQQQGFACDYCADDANRLYGHVDQIGTHADLSLLLLRCPRCLTLYEMSGDGAATMRLSLAQARQRYPDVTLDA